MKVMSQEYTLLQFLTFSQRPNSIIALKKASMIEKKVVGVE